MIEIDKELKKEKEKNEELTNFINNLEKNYLSKFMEQKILLKEKEKQIRKLENQLYLQSYLNSNNLNVNELIKKLELKDNDSKDLKSILPLNNFKEEKFMTIIFTSDDENILHSYAWKNNDKFSRLENLLKDEYQDYMDENNYYFTCKGNKIKIEGTIEENNITNNDIIIIHK